MIKPNYDIDAENKGTRLKEKHTKSTIITDAANSELKVVQGKGISLVKHNLEPLQTLNGGLS